MGMKINNTLIHGFAVLHALTTVVCYAVGIDDALFLTVWTMAMTVLLCADKRLSVEFTGVLVLLVNIVGFVLGVAVAYGLHLLIGKDMPVHAISTFLTTEFLGWSLVLLVPRSNDSTRPKTRWLWFTVSGIMAIRIIIALFSYGEIFSAVPMAEAFSMLVANSAVLVLMICATIIVMHRLRRAGGMSKMPAAVFLHLALFLIVPAICVGLMEIGVPVDYEMDFGPSTLLEFYVLGIIVQVAIYSFIYLIYYVASARRRIEDERNKGLVAQMEYINLKQQVSPHFLFNSLNILDCLVADGRSDEARDFTRKLAKMYRYMLSSENEALVDLAEELEYVAMYTDLLKVRFPKGLEVETFVADDGSACRKVVKYSVQMLVENAYKHNAISESQPLKITVKAEDGAVTVFNTRNPKLSKPESTGLGLKYIRQNYLSYSAKDIEITETAETYSVKLPLL